MNSPISPPWKLVPCVKHHRPLQATELVLAWISETGLTGRLCLCMTQTSQQRQQYPKGVKNAVLSNTYTPSNIFLEPPAWAYRKRADSHSTPCHFCLPQRLLQKSSGICDRDPSRSAAGRRISTNPWFWLTYCLMLASQCSLSGSAVSPVQCLDIGFAQGQGSAGLWHLSLTGNEL